MRRIALLALICLILSTMIPALTAVGMAKNDREKNEVSVAAHIANEERAQERDKGEHGIVDEAGNSNNSFVELFSFDAETGDPILDGPWAKLKYLTANEEFEFVGNAHWLTPEVSYTLIYLPEQEPDAELPIPVVVLAVAVVDEYGNLYLEGSFDLGMSLDGAALCLVLTEDIVDSEMVAWNPEQYLFVAFGTVVYQDTDA